MSRLLRLSALHTILLLLLAACTPSFAQTADFTASPVSGCAPLVVQFSDNSSGPVSTYSWNLGNSTSSSLPNPSTTYSTPGTYTVTLTVTGPAGSDTKTGTITVYDKPAVSFAAVTPAAGCAPHNVQFSSTVTANSPGAASYNWDFGDGNSDTSANPAHVYVTPGTYDVTLTVTNGAGCSRTSVQHAYITVYPVAVPDFSAAQTFYCGIPATVSFTNLSAGGTGPYTTTWNFGDGGTGTGGTVSHTYNAGGGFTVSMTVTDVRGCANTAVRSSYIIINAVPATFSGPLSVCVGADAAFFNTTTGASGTSWNFGDGSNTTIGSSGTHAYSAAGNYTVSMTTTFGGCTKTATKTIIVNPIPTATISMSPSVPCPAPVAVTFTGNSAYATRYAWSWQNGGIDSGQTVTKHYAANRYGYEQDVVTLITTSAAGCKDTVVMDTIMIRDILVFVDPGGGCGDPFKGCAPLGVSFSVFLVSHLPQPPPGMCNYPAYPYPAVSWKWDFGDGSPISTAATPVHTYVNAGDYSVRCIITTPNGCTDTGYGYIHADTPVHPSFIASPLSGCVRDPIMIVNTTDTPLANTLYSYDIIENKYRDTIFVKFDTSYSIVRIKRPGLFTIKMYSDHRGCGDTSIRYNYIVVNPPGADFTDSIFCSPANATVKFINTSISPTSQRWDFGDGDSSFAFSPTHTYPGMGSYFPKLTVYNSVYGCKDTLVKRIQLFIPSFDFTVTDSAICTEESILFHATYFGYGSHMFSWLLDSIPTMFDSVDEIIHKYTTSGYKDVTLYLAGGTGLRCIDTLYKPALILVGRPEIDFKAYPPIGCMPLNIQFRDSSKNAPGLHAASRFWDFGDGDTVTNNQAIMNHIYTSRGRDTVHLVVTDSLGCVSDLLTGFVYVSVHKPKAFFTANDTSVCTFDQVIFRDTAAGAAGIRHQWSFGDGDTATGNPVTHRYTDTGSYTVRLIVTDTVGCTDTLIRSNYIVVKAPHAAFTMSDSLAICPPLLIRFTNQSTQGSSYRWDFGAGGSPVVVTSPVSTYSAAGIYTVRLVVTDVNGCTDTASAQVRVLGYSGAFTYSPLNGCVPMPVQFSTPITGIPQITWDFGDGVTSTSGSTTATHIYTAPRAYVPKVIFSDGHACSSSSTGLDTIRADKVSAGFGWSVPCAGAAFRLSDSSTAVYDSPTGWTWHFGSGDTAVGTPVSYTFFTPGNHPVTLIATNATGCKDTITRDVFINYLPTIDASSDTGVCPGDKVNLLVNGGAKYIWSPAPDSLDNCPVCDTAYVHLDSGSKVYTVTGTDTNGCVNKDSVKLIIQLKTTSSIGDGGEICVGESFRLHAEGAQTYEWLPAETIDSPFIASPLATPQFTTVYIVAAREGTCLVDSQHVQVVVHSLPLFSAGQDEIISLGAAVTLMPTRSGIARIEWRADTTLSCLDCFRPNAYPLYTTTYYATGYNEFGCRSRDSVTVFVRCNGSLVFIPNTFSPNGDGNNDYFFPRGKGIDRMSSFRVFNRWGELIFERSNVTLNDEHAGWDGTYKGRALPPDVYVYTMQSNCATGEPLSWKGDITLMR